MLVLSEVELVINTTKSTASRFSPFEAVYDFESPFRLQLHAVSAGAVVSLTENRQIIHKDLGDVWSTVAFQMDSPPE